MRAGQEPPAWAVEVDAARDELRDELRKSLMRPSDGLFAAIDRFVQAKIEAAKRDFY